MVHNSRSDFILRYTLCLVGSYCTYGVDPSSQSFKVISITCTLGGTCVLCVSPHATLLIIYTLYIIIRLLALPSGEDVLTY